ncbi:MAG: hypothetical protein JWO83_997, partial [Caulobacteraceae bacterium]|nr:hypothetical protein [Caulobacteraceae bacterium]
MKTSILGTAALVGALLVGSAASALTFADYVNVLVPGQVAVTFTSFNDSTAPEFFVGTTTLPIGFQEGTVFLTEPGTGAFSDALTVIKNTTGGIDILFFSDPTTIPPIDILPHQLSVTETGGVQDVSSFFGPNILVQVGSDLNV